MTKGLNGTGSTASTALEPIDWQAARVALDETTERVVTLLRNVDDPNALALGQWSVADLATHLSHAFGIVPGLARRDQDALFGDLWEMPDLMTRVVADDPERDLEVLAGRIETRSRAFLVATEGASADDACPWISEGSTLPLSVLTCHLLNEAVVHGYDIARASGKPWPIDRAAASMIFLGFMLPAFQVLGPRTMVDQDEAAGVRVAYDVRLRGAGRATLLIEGGTLTIEGPSSRKVDCHLSVDPAAFLLVAWNRISQWHAIPRGQLVAWGRRPWMGLRMRKLLRNP